MKASLRRLLRAKREEQIEKATREIVARGDAVAAKAALEQIQIYSALLAEADRLPAREWMWPAVVTSLCIAVIGILWSVHVPRTDVSLSLDTTSVRAVLTDSWRLEDAFHSPLMHFERLANIAAPNLGISIEGSNDAWVELEGGQIVLQSLEFKDKAMLEIFADGNEIKMFASRAPFSGTVSVMGKITVSAGPSAGNVSTHRSYQIEIPETIEFSVTDPQNVPTQFSIHSPNKWSFSKPRVSDISFVKEEVSGAGERALTSGVKSGTARFKDTSWPTLDFREGDLLRVNRTESARLDAQGDGHSMHVTLNGLVGSLTVGDSETRKDLAPSYLEYMYNRKSLAFLWSGIVFLWGLVWRISKTVFGKSG
jgi:hypothetical protein